jgi:hypothetical protein
VEYIIKLVPGISPELMLELAGNECMVTHAHNPCMINILHKTFGWKGGAFLVLANNLPIGYIPAMFVNGHIVSMPHFSFGGLITCHPDKKAIYSEVLPQIHAYFSGMHSGDFRYLIRETGRFGAYIQENKVVSWIKILDKSIEQVIPAAQRSKALKGQLKGLTCKSGGIELLTDFYLVYSRNMLRLGSPVLPKQFFANILNGYSNGSARIFCVYKGNRPVGASFFVSYMGFCENTWFSTLHNYNHLFPAQLLHYEMIKFAISVSGHTYSFGRSTSGSGVHEFKRRWGTEETVVYWNYDKPGGVDLRKAEFMQKIWKLLPLPVANTIGPYFAKIFY